METKNDFEGLSKQEAAKILETEGFNEIPSQKKLLLFFAVQNYY